MKRDETEDVLRSEVLAADGPRDPAERYLEVRRRTLRLCRPLATEDYVAQSMVEASPVRWHIAHTTWFFEEFLLTREDPEYRLFHPAYRRLFNSYYNAVGERTARGERGLLTRPTVAEILDYRGHVDAAMEALLRGGLGRPGSPAAAVFELGLNHEQQHQELILTDLKHLLSHNPLHPVYRSRAAAARGAALTSAAVAQTSTAPRWIRFPGGLLHIGHDGSGFAFDNEGPRHRAYLPPFALADRLATNGEYLAFMADGGYERPELWLDEGWAQARSHGWRAPLYWEQRDGEWELFTLAGMRPVDPREPVGHVSLYEADAFARWAGCRLPSEQEWEIAAASLPVAGNFVESELYHPTEAPPAREEVGGNLVQMFGDLWEWTGSPYRPYPGYQPASGALGEYNGKFMINQFVLRGGSCATPADHVRATYRNFFHPQARWQFSGIRLAKEVP